MSEVQDLPVSSLFVDERNVRKDDEVEVSNLAEDIGENGLIQPVLVRPYDSGFGVVAGSRRLKACREAGLDSIPCIVRDLDDDRALALSVLENHSREDVSAREQVKAIERYFEDCDRVWTDRDKYEKLTSDREAGGFGFPNRTAEHYVDILSVDREIREEHNLSHSSEDTKPRQDGVSQESQISPAQARVIGRELKSYPSGEQEKVVEKISDKSFEETKKVVKQVKKGVEQRDNDIDEVLSEVERMEAFESTDFGVVSSNRTDSELRNQLDVDKFDDLSNRDKLVKIVENELPNDLSLNRDSFKDVAQVKRDLYKIYISLCFANNQYPTVFYNGSKLRSINDIREMIKDSDSGSSFKQVLDRWGELILCKSGFEAADYSNNKMKEYKSTLFTKIGLKSYDEKNQEKPSLI